MMHFLRLTLSTLRAMVVLSLAMAGAAKGQEGNEYAVKAGFLCKFVDFVKWPASATPGKGTPMQIGILGDDPFGGELDRMTKAPPGGRVRIAVRRGHKVEELRGCQIVFVCRSEKVRPAEVVGALEGSSVLVVGESEGFARAGGVIGFTVEGGTVKFEVNRAAAERAGLTISSRLLKLSRVVGDRSSELKP